MQTLVQPRSLKQLMEAPVPASADDIEFEVPVLQLPAMDTDVASQCSVESGAAGMLQVRSVGVRGFKIINEQISHTGPEKKRITMLQNHFNVDAFLLWTSFVGEGRKKTTYW